MRRQTLDKISLEKRSYNRFRLNECDIFVLILLIFKLILTIFIFPEFEMPDEYGHFNHIINHNHKSVYYKVLNKAFIFVNSTFPAIKITGQPDWNPAFHYCSNLPVWLHNGFNSFYAVIFKFINLAIIALLILLLYFVIDKIKDLDEKEKKFLFRLHLLYFSWPAVSLSIMGISPDFLTYLFMPLFFLFLVYYKKLFLAVIVSAIMLKWFDNNASFMVFTAVFYTFFYYLFKPEKTVFSKRKKTGLVFLTIITLFLYSLIIKFGLIGKLIPMIDPHIIYNYKFGYEPIKSMGICFLGLYYLGGSVSFCASWLEYLLFFAIIAYLSKMIFTGKTVFENRFFLFLLSVFLTFHFVLLTFPTVDQGRYYYFLIPAIFVFFDHYLLKKDKFFTDKYYVIFSSIFFISTAIKLFNSAVRSLIF